ncbi:hypothetical protein EV127DRAFT_470102 [Xylaria flabelliformis]|nr:hypothetical protein EV127DRAFT_470102 [Xylaria flabelliformis]
MTPRCRRSARIASASKRSKDSPAPQQLASVAETHDACETPTKPSSRAGRKVASSPMPAPVTPSGTAPPKLAMSEMHPSKVHQTMAPPSSALRNGLTDIDIDIDIDHDYTKTPIQAMMQNTPSKTPVPSSAFTFRSAGLGGDQELGPEAQRMMDSIRKDAAAIKAQLVAERAHERAEDGKSSEGRKIAAAKGKSRRFSAAHMAEFKKMDSIEGHASSFRGAPGRFTPVKATTTSATPVTPLKPGVKRSQSKANLDEPDSARPKTVPPRLLSRSVEKVLPPHAAKRVRQHKEDDASTRRPVSRDESSIPRPKSSGNDSLSIGIPRSQTLGSLMTPTKSSLARTNFLKTPTITLVRSPSQPDFQKINSFSARVGAALARSPSKADLELLARSPSKNHFGLKWGSANSSESSSIPSRVETPGRFGRIKSILKRQPSGTKPKSEIPQFAASAAKAPTRLGVTEDMFPSVPLTTPGRKHDRHVDFAVETKKATMVQNSPSPVKSGIPRSTTLSKLPALKFTAGGKGAVNQKPTTGEVTYPDLSAYQVDGDEPEHLPEPVPGTFTFRSDHTIQVDSSPFKGFGSAAGQASLRQVRKSASSSVRMPGSFPPAPEASPNKENDAPLPYNAIPHGMTNKKRHRASSDEEDDDDDEGSKRGAKKLRKHTSVAEGQALMAPSLVGRASPTKKALGSMPQTPSPRKKKRTGLSLSRLQMLAQPKIRK